MNADCPTRRQFLSQAVTTTAACGLARLTHANRTTPPTPLIDTHVYVGHWPQRRLASEDPSQLIAALKQSNVNQAWVGSFDGLFHKDIAAVNQRLAEVCSRTGASLIPFGTINPTLPDWEDDVRRCAEVHHMPGIRLHPNYHGYTLDEPRFAELVKAANDRKLIVQLVAGLGDERHPLLSPPSLKVDLKPLAKQVEALPDLRLVISGADRAAGDESIPALQRMKQIYFEWNPASSAKRVVFGSGTPLRDVGSVASAFGAARLTAGERSAISNRNAERLMSEGVATKNAKRHENK